jgi:Cu-Zn family superoxide dismutase
MKRFSAALALLPFAALLSCATTPDVPTERTHSDIKAAEAHIAPIAGNGLSGHARFEKGMLGRVTLTVNVRDLPEGTYAVHIHERGDCSSPDGMSAGEHWNPNHDVHGKYDADTRHLGDLDNLKVDMTGRGKLEVTSREWTIGTNSFGDVLGKAIIIHEREDDFTTQPSGNSGAPIACGVIEPVRETPAMSRR